MPAPAAPPAPAPMAVSRPAVAQPARRTRTSEAATEDWVERVMGYGGCETAPLYRRARREGKEGSRPPNEGAARRPTARQAGVVRRRRTASRTERATSAGTCAAPALRQRVRVERSESQRPRQDAQDWRCFSSSAQAPA